MTMSFNCRTQPQLENKGWVSRTGLRRLLVATLRGKRHLLMIAMMKILLSQTLPWKNMKKPVTQSKMMNQNWSWRNCVNDCWNRFLLGLLLSLVKWFIWVHILTSLYWCPILQAPGNSLKLKQLKVLIDEQSSDFFCNFTKKESLAFLKCKVSTSVAVFYRRYRSPSLQSCFWVVRLAYWLTCLLVCSLKAVTSSQWRERGCLFRKENWKNFAVAEFSCNVM